MIGRLDRSVSRPTRMPLAVVMVGVLIGVGPLSGVVAAETGDSSEENTTARDVSPVRRIDRGDDREGQRSRPRRDGFRSVDGSGNHMEDTQRGATETELLRLFAADYADDVSSLAGEDRPSARAISNAVHDQTETRTNELRASDYLWQWGQFVDHDVDLTDGADPAEPEPIAVPIGDPEFDPNNSGDQVIGFNRSIWNEATGTDAANPRQQLNEITAWIDASNVYGSDEMRAAELRTLDGSGRLKTSEGNLLPFNTAGLPNAGGPGATLFLGGDVRANEQLGLTAMHTLFVREHNRQVARLAAENPDMDGDELYEKARQLIGAQMQVITFREFLPVLLGPNAISRYQGYDPDVNATIANSFSGAAYRFGHSALSPTLLRIDALGAEVEAGHLPLRDAFFAPQRLVTEGGMDPLLRGLAQQECQAIDVFVIDDVRNFLFGDPGDGGFDLASLNLQRGRDHGLPFYNDVRDALGFGRAQNFAEISDDPEIQARLAAVYASVDEVDLWTGGLSEPRAGRGHLGRTFARIVAEQFEALRDGDRYWYRLVLSRREIARVESTRLSDIIRANTEIGEELPDDVFRVGPILDGRRGDRQF